MSKPLTVEEVENFRIEPRAYPREVVDAICDLALAHLRGAGQAVAWRYKFKHAFKGPWLYQDTKPAPFVNCTIPEPLYALPRASAEQGQGAAAQEWIPTHRHADGGLYRLLSDGSKYRISGSEWSDCMIYEDASGNRWATTPVRWADRFEEIGASAARPSADRTFTCQHPASTLINPVKCQKWCGASVCSPSADQPEPFHEVDGPGAGTGHARRKK